MTAPFVFSMLFKADTAAAKAALGGVRDGLAGVSAEAGRARGGMKAQAEALDELAAAAGRAAVAQAGVAAEARKAQLAIVAPQTGGFDAAIRAATGLPAAYAASATAADRMRDAVAGLNATLTGQGEEMVTAAAEARAWRGALDEVRASFNPLFAASRQYEAQLDRIADAERMGAISAREAATARQQAAAAMAPIPLQARAGLAGKGPSSFVTANLAAQGNDIAMMTLAGQNPFQLALQQGTQVSQVFNTLEKGQKVLPTIAAGFASMINPVSLATIGIIGFGAFAAQSIGKVIPPTKTLAEAVATLEGAVADYERAVVRLRTTDFSAEFGRSAEAARTLAQQLSEAKRLTAELGASSAMRTVSQSLDFDFWRDWMPLQQAKPQDFFGVGPFDKTGSQAAFAAQTAAGEAAVAKGLDAQIAALQKLLPLWDAAMKIRGGVTKQEAEGYSEIAKQLDALLKMKSLDDNAAGKGRVDEMTRELRNRLAVENAILASGRDSAAVRTLEAAQAKEALGRELDRLGVARDSKEAERLYAAQAAVTAAAHEAALQARAAEVAIQNDKIAAIRRETALLGATAADRARINALAEAEIAIRQRNLTGIDAEAERMRALAKASAEVALEQGRAARALQLGLMNDSFDASIGAARDPVSKADLEAQREYSRVLYETGDAANAQAEANQVRARSMREALTPMRDQIAAAGDELAARRLIAAQVAAGSVAAEDANRLIQQEIALRPLVTAAARAEGAEKRTLTDIILGLRIASEALAAEDRRMQANDLMRGQAERIAALRVELALIGQSAELRARVLGLIEAEREIRRLQLDSGSAEAANIRDQAVAQSRLTAELERQSEAWRKVQSAGETAIDGVLEKLTGGDFKGALADLAQEASKLFLELGVKNPLKNALLGTNYGTMDDLGGLRGIAARLLGGFDESAMVAQGAATVQSMTITAPSVQITAGAVNWPVGLSGPAANAPFAPTGMAGASGPLGGGSVPKQIWDFFTGKGLAAHQVSAILGHAKAESGFDPRIPGDNGNAVGLFQHNGPRMAALLQAIGGRGNLGDVEKQLEFVWRELMTSESGAGRRLMSAPDLASATWAMQGFERPSGFDPKVVGSGMHWEERLAAANQAMVQFGGVAAAASAQLGTVTPAVGQLGATAQTTTGGLGELGQGMGQFGGALQQILGAAVGGDKGGVLSGLLGLGFQWLTGGGKGFAGGGPTGGSDPTRVAGVVHEGEYVFDARATSRIGLHALEAIRRGRMPGYASGGLVSSAAPRVPGGRPGGAAGPLGGGPVNMHFDMRGAVGGDEMKKTVRAAIKQSFDEYDRQVLPKRVKKIVDNGWMAS